MEDDEDYLVDEKPHTHKEVLVTVETVHDDGSLAFKEIDHSKRDDRRWLGRHLYWCMRNNATVKMGRRQ